MADETLFDFLHNEIINYILENGDRDKNNEGKVGFPIVYTTSII